MALLFVDSFDHYATADITEKWTNSGLSPAIVASGRTSNCLQTQANSTYVSITCLGGVSEMICGAAIKVSALPGSGGNAIFAVGSAATYESVLVLLADGTFQVGRVNNGSIAPGATLYYTLVGTASASAISAGVWYYLEWRIFVDNSGSSTVHVNGVEWLDVSAIDTLYSSAALTRVGIGHGSGSGNDTFFDDFYVLSTSGGVHTTFLGDVTIAALVASGAGTTTSWTPSTGSNYACTDESTPNDDTDYVSTAVVDEIDTYAMQNVAAGADLVGVQWLANCKKSDVGTSQIAPVFRHSGTDYVGTTLAQGATTYSYLRAIYETNPGAGSPGDWTESDWNAIEAGFKKIV